MRRVEPHEGHGARTSDGKGTKPSNRSPQSLQFVESFIDHPQCHVRLVLWITAWRSQPQRLQTRGNRRVQVDAPIARPSPLTDPDVNIFPHPVPRYRTFQYDKLAGETPQAASVGHASVGRVTRLRVTHLRPHHKALVPSGVHRNYASDPRLHDFRFRQTESGQQLKAEKGGVRTRFSNIGANRRCRGGGSHGSTSRKRMWS